MGLKTILVCLTTAEHAETLLKVAAPLARRHGAHLIGLHALEALLVYPGIAMHIPDTAFAGFNASQNEIAEMIKTTFEKHTAAEDFTSEFRLVRAEAQSASERMVESAHAADVVIVSRPDQEGERYDQRHAQQQVIRESGRPVIVVPLDYDGPEIGDTIVLGWSDTKEATRAAHDMLNVIAPQASVLVTRVASQTQDALKDHTGIDVTEMLARHGLKATLERRDPMGGSIADVLGQTAFETGADLIVSGAFGHSKAYDFILGATSHALLRDAKLPVLFSN